MKKMTMTSRKNGAAKGEIRIDAVRLAFTWTPTKPRGGVFIVRTNAPGPMLVPALLELQATIQRQERVDADVAEMMREIDKRPPSRTRGTATRRAAN